MTVRRKARLCRQAFRRWVGVVDVLAEVDFQRVHAQRVPLLRDSDKVVLLLVSIVVERYPLSFQLVLPLYRS